MKNNTSIQELKDLVTLYVKTMYGEYPCPDYIEGCPNCEAWAVIETLFPEYDAAFYGSMEDKIAYEEDEEREWQKALNKRVW